MEYSFADMLAILMKRFAFILIATFLGFSSFYVFNRYIAKPTYTASVQLYVNENNQSSADLNELNYAQKVVATYINFLQTKVFYMQVLEESKLAYSQYQLRTMTSIQAVNNTEIFQISVTSFVPEDSYNLAQAMQSIAPKLIKKIKSSAEISVVDPVLYPAGPSGPNVLFNSMIGGIVGFLLSVLVSFVWELLDINVKNQDELTKKYQIPVLAAIPGYTMKKNRRFRLFYSIPFLKKRYLKQNNDRSVNEDRKFMVNEAYIAFRTNLRFILLKNDCKKILISSPVPKDGKSTTSSNIAVSIAQTGARVLLIDCDLRKGRQHNYFHLPSKPGISDILSGMASEKDAVQNTSYDKLHIVTMGAIPPNPTELLGSTQMEEFLKRQEKNYEYIIIDTPPVNIVSDALSLVKLVDGVVIVVREGITSHPDIEEAMTKYKFADADLLGFVLNGATLNQGNKLKSHYYYYRKHRE